ncbi:MAG TPA: hypothetical protein PL185_03115 [Flavobacteriales bacterium]|mgnify:CR=1 FL=1|nr:hypothetical protein [Flavobacteriales bacterium]HPH81531.1 hypothetical protein [Flavobacteriales bacterium]
MKSNKLLIDVPLPCSETWDEMQAVDAGKYCKSCAKHVTDFAGFTDQELIRYFSTISGETCGRFRVEQLNRKIVATHVNRNSIQPRGLWLAGLMGLSGLTIHAQKQEPNQKKEACVQVKPIQVKEGMGVYSFKDDHFHGQAIGNNQQVLPGAVISYVEGRIAKGLIADNLGRFTIQRGDFRDSVITLTVMANEEGLKHISMVEEMKTIEIIVDKSRWDDGDYVVGKYPQGRDPIYLQIEKRNRTQLFFYKLFHYRKWLKWKRLQKAASQ